MKYLHDILQEDELHIHLVKGMSKKVVKGFLAQDAVSNFLLEDQLRVTPQRVVEIKSQFSTHEVTTRFLEPIDFETISTDVVAWKQFLSGLTEPT